MKKKVNSVPEVPDVTPVQSRPARKNKYMPVIQVTGGAFLGMCILLYLIQVVYESNDWPNSPATYLVEVKRLCEWEWEKFGAFITWCSSYIQWLKLEAFWKAGFHLIEPLIGIAFSGFYFFKGYFNAATEYTQQYTIYIGTLIPFAIIVVLVLRYTTLCERIQNATPTHFVIVAWTAIFGGVGALVWLVATPSGYAFLFK